MMNYQTIAVVADYLAIRDFFLIGAESLEQDPYVDSVGIPTIGIGFNLRVSTVQDAVFNELGITNVALKEQLRVVFNRQYSPGANTQLRTDLNAVMAQYGLGAFRFPSTTSVQNAYAAIIGGFESILTNWAAGITGGIPNSYERIALLSIAYNNPQILTDSNRLYGALKADNRAEAWFEIRFETNGGASRGPGIAARTPDQFTINNWYTGTANHVEQFKTATGETLLDTQVQNLVNAMAAFSPPAAGQTDLPPEYAAQLNPVIAASWQ